MTIVVGYTPAEPGRAALAAAIEQARKESEPLVVVNSGRGESLDDPTYAQPADLEWVRTTAEEAGIEVTIRQELRGRDAADELLDVLEEVDASLCVIGIRKRSAVGKMLLGSTANQVLMNAPCPVLTVRAAS
jgi:nucleotide-binding universal stress UspA family protein